MEFHLSCPVGSGLPRGGSVPRGGVEVRKVLPRGVRLAPRGVGLREEERRYLAPTALDEEE